MKSIIIIFAKYVSTFLQTSYWVFYFNFLSDDPSRLPGVPLAVPSKYTAARSWAAAAPVFYGTTIGNGNDNRYVLVTIHLPGLFESNDKYCNK